MVRALLSVSDKRGLVELARGLHARGVELVSTGATARTLEAAGLPVVPVSAVTGTPELLEGRVKTLHPAIHGGILARRHRPEDRAALARHGIREIDLVVVNLYPFAAAAARDDIAVDALLEAIDIGGPSLIRAAAKNFRDVLVVVDPDDYPEVLARCERGGWDLSFRLRLAQKAFAHTAAYDERIAAVFETMSVDGEEVRRVPVAFDGVFPDRLVLRLAKVRDLRYGDNPHQRAAWYALSGEPPGFAAAALAQGKPLSWTNLLDLDAAVRLVGQFVRPAAAIVKHTNPCGVAEADTLAEAYGRARSADPQSAFGGIVGLNRAVDVATARALAATFLEAVVAPDVEAEARAVLAARPNLRLLVLPEAAPDRRATPAAAREWRTIPGGLIVQEHDEVEEAAAPWPRVPGLRVVTRRTPTEEEWRALQFAWRVVACVKSNAIVFARPGETVAVGAGQMSRVDAVKVAIMKGGDRIRGTVVASDAFFPFRDSIDVLAEAGAAAVVQPGGSVRDAEVIAAADEHGLAMVFTGRRHFRH
jgi:phosphoribosylaminoimidazolecarboxamide formyltransferase/IMP cyclohydrolase